MNELQPKHKKKQILSGK